MQPGCGPEPFQSPIGSPIHKDLRRRLMGTGPIKLHFPCFGRMGDCIDPLMYLEQCQDYLALNPVTDEDCYPLQYSFLHTLWLVGCSEAGNIYLEGLWEKFLSALLSEDYIDKLEERIRTRVQGEEENIEDFAYMYWDLCCWWKPDISEEKVIQLILKNACPNLSSQLRSCGVKTVDALVRFGQQL